MYAFVDGTTRVPGSVHSDRVSGVDALLEDELRCLGHRIRLLADHVDRSVAASVAALETAPRVVA